MSGVVQACAQMASLHMCSLCLYFPVELICFFPRSLFLSSSLFHCPSHYYNLVPLRVVSHIRDTMCLVDVCGGLWEEMRVDSDLSQHQRQPNWSQLGSLYC